MTHTFNKPITIVTYPRSGANYLHHLILNHTSISLHYVHNTDKPNETIISIARDPFESIHSHVTMRKHYHSDEGYNRTYNEQYIDIYNFLYDNATIVIDYKDLVEYPEQVLKKVCSILGFKEMRNNMPPEKDSKDRSYLVSSKTSNKYNEKHFDLEDIQDCYEPYIKLLSKKIELN